MYTPDRALPCETQHRDRRDPEFAGKVYVLRGVVVAASREAPFSALRALVLSNLCVEACGLRAWSRSVEQGSRMIG